MKKIISVLATILLAQASFAQISVSTIKSGSILSCPAESISIKFEEKLRLKENAIVSLNLGTDEIIETYLDYKSSTEARLAVKDCPDEKQCWTLALSLNPEKISADGKIDLKITTQINEEALRSKTVKCIIK